MSVDPRQPLHTNKCFDFLTTPRLDVPGLEQTTCILGAPGLDISQLGPDEDRLLILHPTPMNPSLTDQENRINPMDCHFDFRDRRVRTLLHHTGIKP